MEKVLKYSTMFNSENGDLFLININNIANLN